MSARRVAMLKGSNGSRDEDGIEGRFFKRDSSMKLSYCVILLPFFFLFTRRRDASLVEPSNASRPTRVEKAFVSGYPLIQPALVEGALDTSGNRSY